VQVWQEFFGMTSRAGQIGAAYSAYKEITLLAALESVLGWAFPNTILAQQDG
jgi:hypothetical protein